MLVGRNTKPGNALGDDCVKPYINCLYQLKNADTFKLVPVCEQARSLIESHLHFMEKNEKGPDFWAQFSTDLHPGGYPHTCIAQVYCYHYRIAQYYDYLQLLCD